MSLQFIESLGVEILRRAQSQFFGCQIADSLAVHGVVHRLGARHHLYAIALIVEESLSAYRFYLRHDDIRFVSVHYVVEGFAVEHVEHFCFVCHLHGRGIRIAVAGYDILSCTFCCDYKLFSKFSGT